MIRSNLQNKITNIKAAQAAQAAGQVKKEGADYRLEKDMAELDLSGSSCKIHIPNKDNLKEFEVAVHPQEGFYRGGTFNFTVSVPHTYPYDPPKVQCKTPVYHPNIDDEGKVCLNILRADWKPVLTMKAVLYGLELLFIEPNPDDPLNKEATKLLREDKKQFQKQVERTMKGY